MKLYNEALIRRAYRDFTRLLIRYGITITTMESCTSGQIASLITDTEGASSVFKGAFVTYSDEAKIKLGVSSEVIETYSVYSKETAKAMAEACRNAFNADLGIGITGTMGNTDPLHPNDSTPGSIYFAIADKTNTKAFYRELPPQPSRLSYKLAAAQELLDVLYSHPYIKA